jgi:hypothetical protein
MGCDEVAGSRYFPFGAKNSRYGCEPYLLYYYYKFLFLFFNIKDGLR